MITLPQITSNYYFIILTVIITGSRAQLEFLYKQVTLGVVISPGSTSIPQASNLEAQVLELIKSIVKRSNEVGPEEELNDLSQITNITVVTFSSADDFETLPDINFLFSFTDCDEAHSLNTDLTDRFGTTGHVAVTDPGCKRLDQSTSITWPLTWFRIEDSISQLLVDIRQQGVLPNWESAVLIFDTTVTENTLQAILNGLSDPVAPTVEGQGGIGLSIFSVDGSTSSRLFMQQFYEVLSLYEGDANIIVYSNSKNIGKFLEAAKARNALTYNKQWLLMTSDSSEEVERLWPNLPSKIFTDGLNMALITNQSFLIGDPTEALICRIETVINLLTASIENITEIEFSYYLQVSDEEWDIIKPSRLDRIINIINQVYVSCEGRIKLLGRPRCIQSQLHYRVMETCDKSSTSWRLQAAEHGQYGKRIFEVGTWNAVVGLRLTDAQFPHLMGGLRGRRIDVESMHFPPWQIFETATVNGSSQEQYSGLTFEILNHCANALNFSYNVLSPAGGQLFGDSAWDEMIQAVIDKKVVLGAAAFIKTVSRSKLVNFTRTIFHEKYTFLVNRPVELPRILLFTQPFRSEVWVCIITTLIAISPILYVVHRSSYYYKFYRKRNNRGLFKLQNCYWYLYGALLQQGGTHLPESISGRVLVGFWWLFVLVVVTTYSGNLVAFLTFPRIENPVNTLDDLINYRGVGSWGLLANSQIELKFIESTNPVYKTISQNAEKHEFFNNTVLERIANGDHAYIDWKTALLTVMKDRRIATGRCEFALGLEEFFEEEIAFIVPKDSPYLHLFNQEISHMLETGLVSKWKSKYWPQTDQCSDVATRSSISNRTVNIQDMQGSFYLLLLGFIVAVVTLLVEYGIYRRKLAKVHAAHVKVLESIRLILAAKHQAWQQKKYPYPFLN